MLPNKNINSKGSLHRTSSPKEENSDACFSGGEVLCCPTISDSDILMGNRRFLLQHQHSVANKVWDLAVQLGVSGFGNNEGTTERAAIRDMEERDELALAEREKTKRVTQ